MSIPGFTAVMSLHSVASGSGAIYGFETSRQAQIVPQPDSAAIPGVGNDGLIMPALTHWGWWDYTCAWNCLGPAHSRQVRAVLYDIPSGWDWMFACSRAWGIENRVPNSCKLALFGPPPGYVVEGQWWIQWSN